ncbi:isopeptide-forming domain-containing fimbrial protein [Streptomyces sp. 4F14]|uniref:isopeptide-forming domain-containing fimbrial protein n=1 Tax=Streptomyces sp. 4F14 TaxID=3394380 RepID=UPI003A8901B3
MRFRPLLRRAALRLRTGLVGVVALSIALGAPGFAAARASQPPAGDSNLTGVPISPTGYAGLCVTAASANVGAQISLQSCKSGFEFQLWDLKSGSDALWLNGQSLCISNPSNGTDNNVQLVLSSSCTGNDTNWTYTPTVSGSYPAGGLHTPGGVCMNVKDGNIVSGTQIIRYGCDATYANEKFSIGTADIQVSGINASGKPGATVTPSIRVQNLGLNPSNAWASGPFFSVGTSLTATADSGFTMKSVSPSYGWSYAYNTCSISGQNLSCPAATGYLYTNSGTTLHNGAGAGFLGVTGTIPASATPGSTYKVCATNTTSVSNDTVSSNNSGCATVTVLPFESDLAMTTGGAQTNSQSTTPGATLDTSWTLTNNGPDTAGIPKVTFAKPSGVTVNSLTGPSGWSCSTSTLVCTGPTEKLANNGTAAFTMNVTVPASQQVGTSLALTATSSVGGRSTDTESDNDKATLTLKMPSSVAVNVTKTGPSTAAPGDKVEFVVTVTNPNAYPVNGVSLTDTVPSSLTGVTWTCVTGSTCGSASGSGNSISTTVDVPANGTARIRVSGTVAASASGTTVTNTAQITLPNSVSNTGTTSGSASVAIEAQADLATSKTANGSGPVSPGDTFEYTVTVKNNGPAAATNVKATDTLPSQLTFVSSPDGCTASGQTVSCGPVATLANGASKSWLITVRLAPGYTGDGSDIANTAAATSDTTDPNPDNNSGPNPGAGLPGGTAGTPKADVAITKAPVGTASVAPGSTFDYTVTVVNNGPSDAKNVKVSDPLPSQLAFVSSTDGCTGTAEQYGGTVTCPTIATLANGATATYTFTVRLDPAYTGDGSDIKNSATASSDTADPDPGNGTSDPAGLPGSATPQADLSTDKQAVGTGPVTPGETFDYTITVKNNGPSDAVNAKATDTLPSQLTFVGSPDGCTAQGQVVSCGPVLQLANGKSKSWLIRVKLAESYTGDGSDIANTATASSDTDDPNPDNDSGPNPGAGLPGDTAGTPEADLSTTKTSGPTGDVTPGETFTYSITVKNNGPSTAVNAKATDTLPTGLTFVSGDDCAASGQTVTCGPVATLANGASKTWTFTVKLASSYTGDGSDLGNTATASSDTDDPNDDNDSNPDPVLPPGTITPEADLSTDKEAVGSGPVTPGDTFQYTITVKNAGPSDAVNAKATDTLPAPLAFVSGDGCTAAGQDVTCGPVATLAAGASKSWTITVRLSASYTGDGSDIKNTATASSDTNDPNDTNDSGPKDGAGLPGGTPGDPSADLVSGKKALGDGPVTPGETFQYELTVTNNGPSTAVNAKATDTLPTGLTFVSGEGCTAAGQTVTCGPRATLDNGKSAVWVITVKVNPDYTGDGSDLANTVTASSDTDDPNDTNSSGPNPGVTPPGGVGDPEADLSTTKTAVGDTEVAPGETFDYTITVKNNGPSTAVNAKATDTLPSQLTFVSSADGCTAAGQTVTCGPVATLAPDASKSWVIKVRLSASYTGDGSDIANVATGTSDTDDPNTGNDTGPNPGAGLPGGTVAPGKTDLAITKEFTDADAGPIAPGETFSYDVTVTNNGPSVAQEVVVTDPMPKGLTYVSAVNADTGKPVNCTIAGGKATCPAGSSLAVDDSVTVTLTVRLDPAYDGDGSDITNTAKVSSENTDPVAANNTASVTGLPNPDGSGKPGGSKVDVAIKTNHAPKAVHPGGSTTMSFTVTNEGPSTTRETTPVVITMPADVTALGAGLPERCAVLSGATQVSCSVPAGLAPQPGGKHKRRAAASSVAFTLPIQVKSSAPADAELHDGKGQVSYPGDSRPANNTDTWGVDTLGLEADLAFTKTANVTGTLKPGGTFTYTLTVTNHGPSDAPDVKVTDPLPAPLTFVSGDGCSASGQTVTCGPLASLASGATHSWTITVKLAASYKGDGSDIRNTATVSSGAKDPNGSNNTNDPSGSGIKVGGHGPLAETGGPAPAPAWYWPAGALLLITGLGLLILSRVRREGRA